MILPGCEGSSSEAVAQKLRFVGMKVLKQIVYSRA